ncbi:MAG: hypothetical protein AB1918_18805 [Pseudomonadota bacterium]
MTRPRSSLAPLFTSRRAIDEVKRDGWRETGTLAVSADDPRLDAFERQFVLNLGNRLYGPRRGDERRDGGTGAGDGADAAVRVFDGKRSNASGGGQ